MKRLLTILASTLLAVLALAIPAAATTTTATPSALAGWDLTSETRTAGHWEITSAGLHVWTDDASSQAKVAGYVPVSTSLSAVAAGPEPVLDWNGTSPQPGYQLVVNDGTHTFILVGEPIYGGKWWAASCGTFCADLGMTATGGGGSAYQGTLAEWAALSTMDTAHVTAIGFSLGSGIHGDGVITALHLDGDVWTFDADPADETTTTTPPADDDTDTTTTGGDTSTSTADSTDSSDTSTGGAVVTTTDDAWPPASTPAPQTTGDPADLAYTGTPPIGLVIALGVLLLAGGAAVLLLVRRRRAHA